MRYLLMSVGINGIGSWAEIVDLHTNLPFVVISGSDGGPAVGGTILSVHERAGEAADAAKGARLRLSKKAEELLQKEIGLFEIQEDVLERGGAGKEPYMLPG